MSKRTKLSDQIRRAIAEAPVSRYRLCKEIDFSEATMSRFMSGKAGLSFPVLDKIADFLDLRIVAGSACRRKGT